jgi:hypothetical protein
MKPYAWKERSLFDVHASELPVIDDNTACQFLELFDQLALEHGAELRQTILKNEASGKLVANYGSGPVTPALVAEALAHVPNDDADYDFWLRIGFSLKSGLGEAGFEIWDAWSKQSQKYDAGSTFKTWGAIKKDGGVTIGTLFYHAKENGWRSQRRLDGRLPIPIKNGELHEAVDGVERALLASQIEIFRRGNMLVRPVTVHGPGNPAVGVATVTLVQVTEDWLLETFSRIAIFQKVKGDTGEVFIINCPGRVVKAYLARVGEWRVPMLTAIVNGPTLRSDGTVIDKPGYDVPSGLYAAFDPAEFPPIPHTPRREEALQGIAALEDFTKTFPFVSDPDRAVAIAAVLTGLCRHMLPTAPIFGYSAPVAGSGKSLLVDLVSLILTGHTAAVLSQGKSEEELEKRLSAALIQGASVLSLDNCNEALGGVFLCQILTQSLVRTRILGQSTMVDVPTNCLMLATGNNLTFADDMTRRALLCTLDPKVERPEKRQFALDILSEVRKRRGALVVAGLTILRAFYLQGQPSNVELLGSFSEWSRLIRGALVWLDRADPCETIEKIRGNDPTLERNIGFLHQIDRLFGPEAFTTAELVREAIMQKSSVTGGYIYEHMELYVLLSEFSGGRKDLNTVSIGRVLGRLEGRLCNGMMLKKVNHSGGRSKWQLIGGCQKGINNAF